MVEAYQDADSLAVAPVGEDEVQRIVKSFTVSVEAYINQMAGALVKLGANAPVDWWVAKEIERTQECLRIANAMLPVWAEAATLPDQIRRSRAAGIFEQCLDVVGGEEVDTIIVSPVIYADLLRLSRSFLTGGYQFLDSAGINDDLYFEVLEYDASFSLEADQVYAVTNYEDRQFAIAGGVPLEAAALYRQLRASGRSIEDSSRVILEATDYALGVGSAVEPDESAAGKVTVKLGGVRQESEKPAAGLNQSV